MCDQCWSSLPWPPSVIPSSYTVHERRGEREPAERHLQGALALGAPPAPGCRPIAAWSHAELAREPLELVAAQGDRHREAALRDNLADTLHRAGLDDEAMEELKRAVAIFAEVGGHEDELQPGVWRLVEW